MGATVLEYVGALHTGVQLVRDARALIREWKPAKGGAAPEKLEETLQKAEQHLKLAEAEVAKEHGFRICKRHWPPGIMLDEGSRWKCRDCDSVEDAIVFA